MNEFIEAQFHTCIWPPFY